MVTNGEQLKFWDCFQSHGWCSLPLNSIFPHHLVLPLDPPMICMGASKMFEWKCLREQPFYIVFQSGTAQHKVTNKDLLPCVVQHDKIV